MMAFAMPFSELRNKDDGGSPPMGISASALVPEMHGDSPSVSNVQDAGRSIGVTTGEEPLWILPVILKPWRS